MADKQTSEEKKHIKSVGIEYIDEDAHTFLISLQTFHQGLSGHVVLSPCSILVVVSKDQLLHYFIKII